MKYNNPPIIEAIFDIRVDGISEFSIDKIENLHSEIISEYPNKKRQVNLIGKIEFKDNIQVSNESDSQINGVVFLNKNSSRQVQFRKDGFTFNMLKPYSEWKEFSSEALKLWSIYYKNLAPKSIVRIALRYINKIEIPLPLHDFQEFIINMPPIPSCLPQTFSNFFMQTEIPCSNNGTSVIITETFEKPINVLPFILDIDIYKTGEIKNDIQELTKEFDLLRDLKNQTFESCITDNTRKLFD